MGQSIKEIRTRINGVKATRQITNAMQLVASSKLRKARSQLDRIRPYYETVVKSIREIASYSERVPIALMADRPVKKRVIIVLAGDRGLAGSYNLNVIKKTEEILADGIETVLITSGIKIRDHFQTHEYDVALSVIYASQDPTHPDAMNIGQKAEELFVNEEVDQVLLVYTKFHNVLSLEPVCEQIFPAASIQYEKTTRMPLIEYEPSPEVVLERLLAQYMDIYIYGALLESEVSEEAARRIAMENSTKNADEIVETLEMRYNRARQASITQEITEIVSGAEALK